MTAMSRAFSLCSRLYSILHLIGGQLRNRKRDYEKSENNNKDEKLRPFGLFRYFHLFRKPFRTRIAHSAFHRFVCLTMIVVMTTQGVLASPQVTHLAVEFASANAINSWQKTRLWWHASGRAARLERFMREYFPNFGAPAQRSGWDGIGAPRQAIPEPVPQETQEERDARVVRVEILPREATISAGEDIHFIALAYDVNNSPVGGVSFDWDKEDEESGEKIGLEEKGKFAATKEGNYQVKAKFGGREATAKVKVQGVRRMAGQQPIGTRTVSSSDLPQPSRSSLSQPATKERIAKNNIGRQATKFTPAGTKAMPRLLPNGEPIDRWNSDNYTSMNKPGKERGNPNGRKPDGGAGSGNFQFGAPLLALDGRGQDVNFGLSYNSRVWHRNNSDITFDIDGEWPGPGMSLSFGKIVSMGSQNGYMIIEPDGTRRPYTCTLTFYPVNQEAVCKTTDGSFIDYKVIGDAPAYGGKPTSATAYLPDGTEVAYSSASDNAVYATLFWGVNGNTIYVAYRNYH